MRSVVRVVTRHTWIVGPFYRRLCGSTCPKWTSAEAAGWARPFRVKGAEDALEAVIHEGLIGLTPKQIEAIAVPASVIRGDRDPQMGLRSAQLTGRRLHTSRVTTIAHAGHLVMLAQPDTLATAIDADVRSFSAPSE
jgi:pimeloyl-ACP methyl ester carboxylesterase